MRELNPNLLTFDCLLFFHRFQVPFHAEPGFPGRSDPGRTTLHPGTITGTTYLDSPSVEPWT